MPKLVPDAFDPAKRHAPMMFTTDIAMKMDPNYRKIALRFRENPEEVRLAFAMAWFKLTHRDMGPSARYLGPEVPKQHLLWQDPLPKVDYPLVDDWEVNNPAELAKVLPRLEAIQKDFNKKVSLADLIVLGGGAAIEKAAKNAGYDVTVPFAPGRADATQEQTDVASFAYLEPAADGFRNYFRTGQPLSPPEMMIDRAKMLTLTVPEMTVLVGGMRSLNANAAQAAASGIFTGRPGTLSTDYFVNLLDMSTQWTKSASSDGIYEGHDRATGKLKWTATPVDLMFGSSAELRAVAEVYAADDGKEKFVQDFVKAWAKVMTLDRFDLQ